MRTLYVALLFGLAFLLGAFAVNVAAMGGMGGMMDSVGMDGMLEHCRRMMEQHHADPGA